MKKFTLPLIALSALLSFALITPARAADKPKGKEITLSGEAKCAMCVLKEGDKCQTVIQTENKKGKKETYYVVDNEVAKGFHENVCKTSKDVTAVGTVKTVKGKKQLTLTRIAAK